MVNPRALKQYGIKVNIKKGWYKKKGRQDRDGIHEAWLRNRFEYADTPNPITQSLLVCHS